MKKHLCDKKGPILILQTLTDDSELIFHNFNNANTAERQQIQTFNDLNMLLSNLDLSSDFILFLDHSPDGTGVSPSLKNTLLSKLLKITQKLNLCDFWQVQNPKKMQYTFRQQQHFFSF